MDLSPVSAVAGSATAAGQASTQVEVQVQSLSKAMKVQEEALMQLLNSLGVGQNLDVEA